jgi:hypothetical protein
MTLAQYILTLLFVGFVMAAIVIFVAERYRLAAFDRERFKLLGVTNREEALRALRANRLNTRTDIFEHFSRRFPRARVSSDGSRPGRIVVRIVTPNPLALFAWWRNRARRSALAELSAMGTAPLRFDVEVSHAWKPFARREAARERFRKLLEAGESSAIVPPLPDRLIREASGVPVEQTPIVAPRDATGGRR